MYYMLVKAIELVVLLETKLLSFLDVYDNNRGCSDFSPNFPCHIFLVTVYTSNTRVIHQISIVIDARQPWMILESFSILQKLVEQVLLNFSRCVMSMMLQQPEPKTPADSCLQKVTELYQERKEPRV